MKIISDYDDFNEVELDNRLSTLPDKDQGTDLYYTSNPLYSCIIPKVIDYGFKDKVINLLN
jgi:hypothetical protein